MSIRNILNNYLDEIHLINTIFTYTGGIECQKCYNLQYDKPLTIILSFTIGTCNLDDIPNNNYKFKKVCKHCLWSRCSSLKIYREIN